MLTIKNNQNIRGFGNISEYIEKYPDIKSSGVDPWEHYRTYGAKEGRVWGTFDKKEIRPKDKVLVKYIWGGDGLHLSEISDGELDWAKKNVVPNQTDDTVGGTYNGKEYNFGTPGTQALATRAVITELNWRAGNREIAESEFEMLKDSERTRLQQAAIQAQAVQSQAAIQAQAVQSQAAIQAQAVQSQAALDEQKRQFAEAQAGLTAQFQAQLDILVDSINRMRADRDALEANIASNENERIANADKAAQDAASAAIQAKKDYDTMIATLTKRIGDLEKQIKEQRERRAKKEEEKKKIEDEKIALAEKAAKDAAQAALDANKNYSEVVKTEAEHQAKVEAIVQATTPAVQAAIVQVAPRAVQESIAAATVPVVQAAVAPIVQAAPQARPLYIPEEAPVYEAPRQRRRPTPIYEEPVYEAPVYEAPRPEFSEEPITSGGEEYYQEQPMPSETETSESWEGFSGFGLTISSKRR